MLASHGLFSHVNFFPHSEYVKTQKKKLLFLNCYYDGITVFSHLLTYIYKWVCKIVSVLSVSARYAYRIQQICCFIRFGEILGTFKCFGCGWLSSWNDERNGGYLWPRGRPFQFSLYIWLFALIRQSILLLFLRSHLRKEIRVMCFFV